MKTLYQEAFIFLVIIIGTINANPRTTITTTSAPTIETIRTESCPRDCICSSSTNTLIARCNRLEEGTQKFGSDISDLIIDNVNDKYPIVLNDSIFLNLGLQRIFNIRIVNRYISYISPRAFNGLSELFSVNLTGNKIRNLDPDTFVSNQQLYLLSLSENPSIFSKASSRFLNSESLQELDISKCGITKIPLEAFAGTPNLMYINLFGNKLTKVDTDTFSNLNLLEEINLSNNFLKNIPTDLFKPNNEVTTLYLGNNPLTSVEGININELLALGLENTNLRIIKNYTFQNVPYLSNLILSGSEINELESDAFAKINDLNYLDLSNNNIQNLPADIIEDNFNLDVFKIANNTLLKSLPEFTATENFNIHLFDASGCSIEIIKNDTFKKMTDIAQLKLSNNKISTLGSSLQYLNDLNELDVSGNSIELIDKYTFEKNKELKKLNLAGNPLVLIFVDVFAQTPMLERLDISNCQLYQLWDSINSFPPNILNKLQFINASSNQIESISTEELDMLTDLKTFDVSKNPLKCNLRFAVLMTWLGDHNVSPSISTISHENEIEDNNEIELKGINQNHQKWKGLAKEVCLLKDGDDYLTKIRENETKKINLNGDYIAEDDENEDDYYDEDDDDDDGDDDEESTLEEDGATSEEKSKKIKNNATSKNRVNVTTEKNKQEKKPKIILKFDKSKYENNNVKMIKNDEMFKENPVDDDNYNEDVDDMVNIMKFEEKIVISEQTDSSFYSELSSISDVAFSSIIIILILILIFLCVRLCIIRGRISVPRSSVKTISGNHGKVKRDCGLVYQQLTEELNGPKTPIIKKHIFSNMTSESNPFQNTIVPEAV